jgi:hypothetical protein
MATADDADDLVPFRNVTVISSTATALLCGVGSKSVWLPRKHTSGRLRCMGDRGTLLIRRWVARDRRLVPPHGTALVSALGPSKRWRRLVTQLRLLRSRSPANVPLHAFAFAPAQRIVSRPWPKSIRRRLSMA